MSYFLCAAGNTLRNQINNRWPKRDKASDGWIGDASHQAVPSDHNPDYSAGGVVRAIDTDSDLRAGEPNEAYQLANQLRKYCQAGKAGGRVSYIIYDRKITSGTYASAYWTWRTYSGSDPHTSHIHVSFTPKGDAAGARFTLPIFTHADRKAIRRQRSRIRKALADLAARIRDLRARREAKRRKLNKL